MELRDSVVQRYRGSSSKVNWPDGSCSLTSSKVFRKASGRCRAKKEEPSDTAGGPVNPGICRLGSASVDRAGALSRTTQAGLYAAEHAGREARGTTAVGDPNEMVHKGRAGERADPLECGLL